MIQKLFLRPRLAFAVAATSVKLNPLFISVPKKRLGNFRTYGNVVDIPKYDDEFDVIVVGSGAGGLTTAVTAAISGNQKVLVAEKTGFFGGTTAYSGGAIWAPMNPISLGQGFLDSREQAELYIHSYLKGDDYSDDTKGLVSAYLDSAPDMVKLLEAKSATQFIPAPTPDYYMHLDGACKDGRTLLNAPYDGRRLGKLVEHVRYPLQGYCAFGSLQIDALKMNYWKEPFKSWDNFSHVSKSLLRYTIDRVRFGKGTELCNGNALVGRLLESALNSGVTLWRNAAATEPILEQGQVVGLLIKMDGQELRIRARKGVALASGGFSRSTELSRKYLPNPDWTASSRGNVGDGMRIGVTSGGNLPAPLGNDAALWTKISELRPRKGPVRSYPHFAIGITKPGSIIVDSDGKRFANEAAAYQDLGRATHAAGVRKEYLIGDKRHLQKYGMGMALPAPYPVKHLIHRGYLVTAPTIPALAYKLGMDSTTLSATIERFNCFARNGKDLDFGRGNGSFDQAHGDPEVKPNPSMAPLEQGPFYAITMYPGHGVTMYGLETNRDAQVLNASGSAVPGLYAVGADSNHFLRGRYPSGGLTLGPSMVFGYRAGLHLSQ